MTLLIEGRTYVDTMGATVGPMKRATTPPRSYPWYSQNNIGRYDDTGRASSPNQPCLLYELGTPTAEGPVRRRTATEIRSGDYGRIRISHNSARDGTVWLGLLARTNPDVPVFYPLTAEELDALAATATQLADALRAIAAEKNQ